MQVSIRRTPGTTPEESTLAVVAFEFGSVKDPHELLQDEARWRVWRVPYPHDNRTARELAGALMDKHRGFLGRRGCLWVNDHDLSMLRVLTTPNVAIPWEESQVMCPATLLWAARRVPQAHFRAPAPQGLEPGNALHDAVQQAVLLQAAFRALSLHKDFPARGKARTRVPHHPV
jgi:hypothetical protein